MLKNNLNKILQIFFILLINDNLIFKNNKITIVLTLKSNHFDYIGYYKTTGRATTTTTAIPIPLPSKIILKSTAPGFLFIPNINNNKYVINKNEFTTPINQYNNEYINYYFYKNNNNMNYVYYNENNNNNNNYKKNKDYQYYNTDNYDENTQNETGNSDFNGMQYEYNEIYQTVPEYSNLPILKINAFDYEKYPIYETQKSEKVNPADFSQYSINSQNLKLFTVIEPKKKLNCDPGQDTIVHDEVVKEKPTLFNFKHKKHKKHKEMIKPVTEYAEEYEDIINPENNISSSGIINNNDENDYIAQDLTLRDVEFFQNYYDGHSQKLRSSVVFPGTIWCGPGNKAPSDNTFGFFFKTDACCRDHDRCFDTIAPREEKYGLYNSGIFTKSHCDCDLDFYVCLKKVNTFVSYKVGYAYFNVLRPQCFRKEFPVVKCVEWYNKRCQVYMLDETKSEKYQWFDNRYF